MTLKISSAMRTHVLNIYAKFHQNPFTKCKDIASREIGVNRRTEDSKTYCLALPIVGIGGIKIKKENGAT